MRIYIKNLNPLNIFLFLDATSLILKKSFVSSLFEFVNLWNYNNVSYLN